MDCKKHWQISWSLTTEKQGDSKEVTVWRLRPSCQTVYLRICLADTSDLGLWIFGSIRWHIHFTLSTTFEVFVTAARENEYRILLETSMPDFWSCMLSPFPYTQRGPRGHNGVPQNCMGGRPHKTAGARVLESLLEKPLELSYIWETNDTYSNKAVGFVGWEAL